MLISLSDAQNFTKTVCFKKEKNICSTIKWFSLLAKFDRIRKFLFLLENLLNPLWICWKIYILPVMEGIDKI